jgi:dihydrofolate reductase
VGSLSDLHASHPDEDIWVIGGAAVYTSTIAQADELVLTEVLGDFHCTKFFPKFTDEFALEARGDEREEGGVRYRFETWKRLADSSER